MALGLQPARLLSFRGGPVALADVNHDGVVDILAVADQSGTVGVLLGNGDGTFEPVVPYLVELYILGIEVADLNGDGDLDIVAANWVSGNVYMLLGNGDGTFAAPSAVVTSAGAQWLEAADFDGNGTMDLAVSSYDSLTIFLGNGDGTFATGGVHPAGHLTRAVALDANGDGKLDIATTGGGSGSQTVRLFLNHGDGTFAPQIEYEVGGEPDGVSTADLNADGLADLLVTSTPSNDVAIFPGKVLCGGP